MKFLSKSELKYILIASAFGFVYFLYILPFLLTNGVETAPPILQFLLFSVGIYFLYFFMFKSWSLGTKESFGASAIGLIPFLLFDLLSPELHVNPLSGALDKGATLGGATPDYNLGVLWQGLGVNGYFLVLCTYLISLIIGLFLLAFIRKNFVSEDIK